MEKKCNSRPHCESCQKKDLRIPSVLIAILENMRAIFNVSKMIKLNKVPVKRDLKILVYGKVRFYSLDPFSEVSKRENVGKTFIRVVRSFLAFVNMKFLRR